MSKTPDVLCENCGKPSQEHWLVNYSDGPHATQSVLVCPTSVFRTPHAHPEGEEPDAHERIDVLLDRLMAANMLLHVGEAREIVRAWLAEGEEPR